MKVATSNGVLLAAVLLISITAGERNWLTVLAYCQICSQISFVHTVINWKEYVNKIGAHVIRQLEAKQITGDGMPLRDFESSIKYVLVHGDRAVC